MIQRKIIVLFSVFCLIYSSSQIIGLESDKVNKRKNEHKDSPIFHFEETFGNMPYFRTEFIEVLKLDSMFTIPFIIENGIYFFTNELVQHISINNSHFYSKYSTSLRRFQSISIDHEWIHFIEFTYYWREKKKNYQCLIIYKHSLDNVIILLWHTNEELFKDRNIHDHPFNINQNTDELFTCLPKEYIKDLFPDFKGTYNKLALRNLTFHMDFTEMYYGEEKYVVVIDYKYPEFYDFFKLNFK